MYKFRDIIYDIQTINKKQEVVIDLASIKYIAEQRCLGEAISLKEYMSKLKRLGSDIAALGKEIYKYDSTINFGYYSAASSSDDFDSLFGHGFGMYHNLYDTKDFRYTFAFSATEVERELKINSILDSGKFGGDDIRNP